MTRLQKKARKDRAWSVLAAVFISVALLGGIMYAPAVAAVVTWSWAAPTEGTPVHHYIVETSKEGGSWVRLATEPAEPWVTMEQEANLEYLVRVAGVDAEGHQGGWSTSDPDTYGAPGACGKPGRE